MATVTTAPTFGANGAAPSTLLNQMRDLINVLVSPPLAVMRQTVVQSIPNDTWTSIALDVHDVDHDGGHSTTTNNSQYTAKTAGWYDLQGTCSLNSGSTTGIHAIAFQINGAARFGKQQHPSGQFSVPSAAATAYLAVGDYVEMRAYHLTGAAINTGIDDGLPRFQVRWVSM